MVQGDDRLQALLKHVIYDIRIVLQGFCIDRGPWKSKWHYTAHGDGEGILFEAYGGKPLDVLFVEVVVLVRGVVGGQDTVWDQLAHGR